MRTPFLSGERVNLRLLEERDADGPYVSWFNDAEVCRGNSHHVFPYTRERALEYISHTRRTRDDLVLAIEFKEDNRHVGNIALQGIDLVYRSAEFAIVLGDRSVWGKGIAKEASLLIVDHGFGTLNLHRIYCGTFDDNVAMRKLAASLGMREEGYRRQAAFKEGRYLDVIEFGVLQEEFWRHRSEFHRS